MKAIAIFEGPESRHVAGFRHYMTLVDSGYPRMTLGEAWRMPRTAAELGLPFYPAGTWEQPGHWPGMPLPRPEIVSELAGTRQADFAFPSPSLSKSHKSDE